MTQLPLIVLTAASQAILTIHMCNGNQWPYVPYSGNFTAYSLQQGNDSFGSIYLYTGPNRTLPSTVPAPTQGHAYPPDPGNHSSFPDMFNWIANKLGQAFYDMNRALADLHMGTMGGHSPDAGQLAIYTARANTILGALGFSNGNHPFWPLVPANTNANIPYGGYVIQPGQPGPAIVSTVNVPNSAFGGNGNALTADVQIAGDSRAATASLVFYQDCEWDAVAPSSTSAWMSWGFVTSFDLQLFERAAGSALAMVGVTGTSSSSSSSLYAASSAMPMP